ncbi:MAG: cytidine deaminase [Bacteroidetes bacterium RIFCSPLOWO2_02_FULL_36_8]|nr:MAG: cytidine deaminase [Bacteroidetes bacterium RIFCSPLOWO2_02_FULL_36_8]OFY71927.1 MAG: cytidine deaminase [Bacteroidetes bacterium RIFCSPLOWO2_12_FULL_37_12]
MPKTEEIKIKYKVFNRSDKINTTDELLLKNAENAVKNAYAPYSDFHVGAAVRLKNGKIVTGNNQENAAYSSGLCAERVAVFSAVSQFPTIPISAIAICAAKGKQKPTVPVPPCGACRQVLLEYEEYFKSPIKVLIRNGKTKKIIVIDSVADLLPFKFNKSFL